MGLTVETALAIVSAAAAASPMESDVPAVPPPIGTVELRARASVPLIVATTSATLPPRSREGRTDWAGIDPSDDSKDIAKIERYIEKSVKLMKGIEARSKAKSEALRSLDPQLGNLDALRQDRDEILGQAKAMESHLQAEGYLLLLDQDATLGELKKANAGLQAECAKLLAGNAKLEAERSQLLASKAMLETECTQLKKAKDTAVAELVDAQSRAKSMVAVTEARTQDAELARDRLATVALNVLGATPLLAQGSSPVSIDGVVQQLEKMPAAHGTELRETAKLASSHALAIVKSLYPQVEVDAVCNGFTVDCDETTVMKYINEAQKAAESVADNLGL
ncbi:uncharacterized protein LOC102718544 [Oryza brachyantha]|uniref:uncharacterized protein LOC102718544 n=1 Tax=Oryza brachyantha TaxID=4533 RepID=UPI0003EA7E66|nr:uncharacterized protein LOC102718544 [Oryza brachyantha]